jgi:CRISPR-associated endonuclease Csn1
MGPTREEIYRRDGFRCVYCCHDGTTFEGWRFLTLDHVIPLSGGGSTGAANLVTACVACNNQKWNRVFANLEAAKEALRLERENEVRRYWEQNVRPR